MTGVLSTGNHWLDGDMREFRVEPDDGSRRRKMRRNTLLCALTISSPLFMILILFFISGTPHLRTIVPLAIFAVCAGVFYVAARLGIERGELNTVYLLTERELVRRRNGWPDDRIAFAEIDAVSSTRRCLVIRSTDQFKKIAIPRKVNGFAYLLSELEEHRLKVAQS